MRSYCKSSWCTWMTLCTAAVLQTTSDSLSECFRSWGNMGSKLRQQSANSSKDVWNTLVMWCRQRVWQLIQPRQRRWQDGLLQTLKDLRSFLGFASYYWQFVPGFSQTAVPLHQLTAEISEKWKKKNSTITSELWNGECQKAFDDLRTTHDCTRVGLPWFLQAFHCGDWRIW